MLYFGSKKGAQLTLLEKSGNDFDQAALLVALLRAQGYTDDEIGMALRIEGMQRFYRHFNAG